METSGSFKIVCILDRVYSYRHSCLIDIRSVGYSLWVGFPFSWLFDCLERGSKLPEKKYLISDQESFNKAKKSRITVIIVFIILNNF